MTGGSRVPSRRRVFPAFPEPEDIKIVLRQACPKSGLSKGGHWRIDGFVGQLKGAEVHPKAATGP